MSLPGLYQLCGAADSPPEKGDTLHGPTRKRVLETIDEEWLNMLKKEEELVARWAKICPRPLPEAEALRKARERVRRMTPDEFLKSVVDAGIYYPDGNLRPEYGGEPEK